MNRIVSISLQTFGILCVNALYFNAFDDLSASRWICWGYIHLAYALTVAAVFSVRTVSNGHVYAYPKIVVALIFYIISLVVGVIMMIINCESTTLPLVVFLLFTGGGLALYLLLMATETKSISKERHDKACIGYIKHNAERLAMIKDGMGSGEGKKIVEKAYDAIRGAEVTSIPDVVQIEDEIASQIDKISDIAESGDLDALRDAVGHFVTLVRKRDVAIRFSKK